MFNVDPDLAGLTGFEAGEIDRLLSPPVAQSDPDTDLPEVPTTPVARQGDLWICEEQKLFCGSASDPECYRKLFGTERSKLLLTDPPYGCKIKGHVSQTHDEFVEGSGYDEPNMIKFLGDFASSARSFLLPGSLAYVFMDGAGMFAAQTALRQAKFQQKAILVWDKQVGGMGTFYRQQAEFIIVGKLGVGAHTNNIRLGAHGRNRTTVISYPGLSQFGTNRAELLKLHPTVKPVGLLADLILDASKRGDLVLDPFLGSGTTLLAAHRTGRRGRGIELDPKYVDVAIMRLQQQTGKPALHATSGKSFAEVSELRTREQAQASVPASPQPKVITRRLVARS